MFTPLTPLRCLHRAMDVFGPNVGVVCGERRFTYAQFGARCQRLAGALKTAGVAPRDRVAYLSFNSHQLVEGYFGVVQAGAIFMPLNVRLTLGELADLLNRSAARVLFHEAEFAPLTEELRKACPLLERCVALDATYEEMLAAASVERAVLQDISENAVAELFYTSGSSAAPKGVMLSHRALYLHALSVALTFRQEESTVLLHAVPLFHANGWGCVHSLTLMGGRHVLLRRFSPAAVFDAVEREGVTSILLVPAMAHMLLHANGARVRRFGTLREIHLGGAASTPELIARLEDAFACACISGYGLTESSPVATNARSKTQWRAAAAGRAVPGMEARVVDAEMQDVACDGRAVGEVVLRGDHVMEGYFGDLEATTEAMRGGWLHTGDLAVWDPERFVRIVDRAKDVIVSGGENISSLEVERAIAAHPAVLECAVVAAPDEKWGETPVAYVVWKAGVCGTADGDVLRQFLQGKLAGFKIPRRFEFSETPLPKTGSGKILKRELREKLWAGRPLRVQG